MAKKKTSTVKPSAMDFLVKYMRSHSNAVYADAQAAAKKAGYKIFPIMWGRAQVMLGRVKAKRRGASKKATGGAGARKASTRTGVSKKVGRPRKVASRAAGGSEHRVVLPIDSAADLESWQTVVEKLNGGGKVAMQYDGSDWLLVEA